MKRIQRFELIDKIGRELQSRMTYSDIDVFLSGFGIDCSVETSNINSKWVYSKELLANADDHTIIRIADELDIDQPFVVTKETKVVESSFWISEHFRLFICHLSSFKEKAGYLQRSLSKYGISAFVAHVDIEPTREWQMEIEAALSSMDALAAILMPGFKESNWTNQEIGFAMGRGVLVVPIIRGLDPYGFIGKYQGLSANGKSVDQVAEELFMILVSSSLTRSKMAVSLVELLLRGQTEEYILEKTEIIDSVADFPISQLERLREGAMKSNLISETDRVIQKLNLLLKSRGLHEILEYDGYGIPVLSDDDIPF